jgi:hypothetical protein
MGELAIPGAKRFRNRPRRTTGAQARSAAPEREHDMYDNHAHGGEHRGKRRERLRRAGLLAAALACLALVAAACSSPASPGTGAGPAGGSARHSELAYSRCMRAHGIKDFPDPSAQGGIDLNGGPGSDLNPSSPQFKAANNACKSLLPPQHALSPAQQAKVRAQALRYSRCMRAHGISDFPDPDSQGQLQIKAQPGGDLDPNNPLYKAADKACRQYMPGGGKGTSNSSNGQPPGSGGGQ